MPHVFTYLIRHNNMILILKMVRW